MENSSYKSDFRNKSCIIINNILNNNQKSRQIEKDIYNSCLKYANENNIVKNWENKIFKSLYISRIRNIYSNLDSNSYLENKNFKLKIINGDIDSKKISTVSKYDIYPEVWGELLSKLAEKD